ncbi:MAG TPA: RecQ family ATP-dependent DNA helicase, partial [Pyrinomonadaceae bacterium]|nr:RecQ family ATP-dependent DNA helicase [Pyrinomonadaceae bacterium]
LVYVAPERFRSNFFVEALRSTNVSLFAVDEAHCVSTWGHDFRPDYLRLKSAIAEIGRPQVAALTATATPYVRADIIEQLGLVEPRAFVSGFDRPNLSLNVVHTQKEREKIAHVRGLAATAGGSGIIYSSTRKSVEQVAARLREARLSVVAYHAGMEDAERVRAQEEFMTGAKQMIVATNAFGMGIDKPDIRFVAHYHLPGSIEAYYQEIGRAGRDGLPASCVLLFNYADKRTQDYFIEGSYPPPEVIAKVYEALVGTKQQRIELSTREIAARAAVRNEMAVQSALIILEKAGHIERGAASENRASVRLLLTPTQAREAVNARRSARDKQVLTGLLDGFTLSQRSAAELDLNEVAESIGLDAAALRRSLASLAEAGLIAYQPARRTRGVLLKDERPVERLNIRPQDLARRAALEQRKLREMISFCYIETCYRPFILDYFGDRHHAANCGTCGNCRAPVKEQRTIQHADDDLVFASDELKSSMAALAANEQTNAQRASSVPLDPPTPLDRFVRAHTPVALDLERELDEQSRFKEARARAEAEAQAAVGSSVEITQARELSDEEQLIVRKILACAARMDGRFGKAILAATLRGSRQAKVLQTHLDRLSTYGLLAHLTQEEIMLYVDALVAAGCLRISGGAYPTVALTALGNDVMRERAQVQLALPAQTAPVVSPRSATRADSEHERKPAPAPRVSTVEETYAFYQAGMTIEEISQERGLTVMTVEKHLAECIVAGRAFDVARHVNAEDRTLIELAIERLGTERLKPLRDQLPRHITYRMLRFVVADLQRAAQPSETRHE